MGLPARKHEPRTQRVQRPRLRVAKPGERARQTKRSECARTAAARQTFQMFAVVTAVVALLGVGRVWLSAEAAEASRESARLRSAIRAERYEGDMLEVRWSSLGSPSRVGAVASATMDMAPPASVTYLRLDNEKKPQAKAEVASGSERPETGSGLPAAIARAVDLAAGEAHVLLVGDVGLASAR